MKAKILILLLSTLAPCSIAQTYHIDRAVVDNGGGVMQADGHKIIGAAGQPVTGVSGSSLYHLRSGFWVGRSAGPEGCGYRIGDINNDGQSNGTDVIFGLVYFKGGIVPPIFCDNCPQYHPFYAAGDVNGSCAFNGIDLTYYVRFLKGQESTLGYCITCPPGLSFKSSVEKIPAPPGKTK